jgi:hypothetical protein
MASRRGAARLSRATHGAPPPGTVTPDPDTNCPDTDPGRPTDRAVQLAAIGQPRPSDDWPTERLRRALRNRQYMARVAAAVDQWPALTDDQRDTIAALLQPHRKPP